VEVYAEGLREAIRLLVSLDPQVMDILARTLRVSGTATLISIVIGVPAGAFLALRRFAGRNLTLSLVYLGMGAPPVVVGLITWLTLTRYGPLGFLGWLYTTKAMIVAQAVIASPIIAGFTVAAIQSVNPKIRLQILALGATQLQMLLLLLREARLGILAAIIAGFGGVISEVGASIMVGGNIEGETRVMTTAIVLEVSKGQTELATALSIILLLMSFLITFVLTLQQQKGRSAQ